MCRSRTKRETRLVRPGQSRSRCDAAEREDVVHGATTELIRKIERERAWVRLEKALCKVEWTEARSREMTCELDRWRAETDRDA